MALRGAGYCVRAWRRVAIYICPLRAQCGQVAESSAWRYMQSTWAGEAHHRQQHRWPFIYSSMRLLSSGLTSQCFVFSQRMATRGVWIPEFLVHICCFSSLITSTYVKNLVPYVQKELPDLRRCICHSYITHSADWASLKWPHRQLCKGFKFHGCLREREIADERYDGPTVALCLLMCESQYHHAPYSLQSASLKWTDAACHHQLRSVII